MDTLVDDLSQRLALRIKLERDGRGWSLAELAERAEVRVVDADGDDRGDDRHDGGARPGRGRRDERGAEDMRHWAIDPPCPSGAEH